MTPGSMPHDGLRTGIIYDSLLAGKSVNFIVYQG